MNGWPEWAIISVASVDTLAKHAAGGTRSIVKGTGDHNAIVELEESEEEAFDLALALAKRTKHDVYVLLLEIHTSLEDRETFVVPPRGQPRKLAEDPGDVAVRLGCVLPRPQPISDEINHRALVAIGLSIEELTGIVGTGHHCVASPRGVIMYTSDADFGLDEDTRLSTVFAEAIVYSVNVEWDPLEVAIICRRGGKELGRFLWPTPEGFEGFSSGIPLWKEVEGETEPLRILAKLGVD
ncbi:MAG: hypothetical protein ABI867_08030, partial [Kofleriaceae bacterium]